ncbi:VCBS repeat-containing protein [Streptomyces sp. ISL-36]|uniref:FG-GAP repeat domain-containing protein n=1 Tax=Streptomyces sp. ISL-36 TaxID=2819182 RepID=UPI001BE86AE7|nr:FG-GAP-like repeat-containing protein [Streptomyces sp. ISL-36]MBT2440032.1 VCBS repeat-containing protein [Streptomyces sp. ISL-36]
MAKTSGLNTAGILSRVTVAAITAALVSTTTAAVAAEQPRSADATQQSAPAASTFATQGASAVADGELRGVDKSGFMYAYLPNGTGGFGPRQYVGSGWEYTAHLTMADMNADGETDGAWDVTGGRLSYTAWGQDSIDLGGGWGVFTKVVSAGNLGGAAPSDLLALDGAGNLYLYTAYSDGRLAPRYKVGTGWQVFNQITGKGDLNNDGKNDVIARDKSGYLWVYPGTGNYQKPFGPRIKAGTGWNSLPTFVSSGDVDYDGVTDVVARDTTGNLYLYPGSGTAAAPFKARTKIGTGWNTYRLIF